MIVVSSTVTVSRLFRLILFSPGSKVDETSVLGEWVCPTAPFCVSLGVKIHDVKIRSKTLVPPSSYSTTKADAKQKTFSMARILNGSVIGHVGTRSSRQAHYSYE